MGLDEDAGHVPTTVAPMAENADAMPPIARHQPHHRDAKRQPHAGRRRHCAECHGRGTLSTDHTLDAKPTASSAPLRGVSWTGNAFHRSHLGRKADGYVGPTTRRSSRNDSEAIDVHQVDDGTAMDRAAPSTSTEGVDASETRTLAAVRQPHTRCSNVSRDAASMDVEVPARRVLDNAALDKAAAHAMDGAIHIHRLGRRGRERMPTDETTTTHPNARHGPSGTLSKQKGAAPGLPGRSPIPVLFWPKRA